MKKLFSMMMCLAFTLPVFALAADIEESEVDAVIIEKIAEDDAAPAVKPAKKADLSYTREKTSVLPAKPVKQRSAAPKYVVNERKGRFQAGVLAPGLYFGNRSIGPMMGIGLDGEYFIFEKLSVNFRAEVSTDFEKNVDTNTIVSFIPRVRYTYDFESRPRWSVYAQAGAGLALFDARRAAADIAIPGVGFFWQWTDNWSLGADASLHILVRSSTAAAFCITPMMRYMF